MFHILTCLDLAIFYTQKVKKNNDFGEFDKFHAQETLHFLENIMSYFLRRPLDQKSQKNQNLSPEISTIAEK